jgi:hypothetical protein
MKWASLTLLGVLATLHWLEGHEATALPLSMFRDGNHAWLGYSTFALLILMGVVLAHAAYRCRESLACLVYTVGSVMLVAIAATPSIHPLHILISLLLPVMLHAFYLRLLSSVLGLWKFLHPSVPLLLALAVQFHSYGAWQKSMILYLVLLANIHYGLLSPPVRGKKRKRPVSMTNRELERLVAEGWIDRRAALVGPRP